MEDPEYILNYDDGKFNSNYKFSYLDSGEWEKILNDENAAKADGYSSAQHSYFDLRIAKKGNTGEYGTSDHAMRAKISGSVYDLSEKGLSI